VYADGVSKQIQVVLLEDIASLGRAGDIVSVAEGYARNALFPTGKAALATEGTRREHEQHIQRRRQQEEQRLKELQEKAEVIEGTELVLKARVKDGDEIYGSITPKEIVEALNEQAQLTLQAKDISIKKPLKKTGSQEMTVQLSPEVECMVVVSVVPDEESKQEV
jgi:large subunit ribosomal protein L9